MESAGLTIGNQGVYGAPGWIRTSTRPVLSGLPLPVGLRAHGRLGRIRTDTGHGLSVLPLPSWATSLVVFGARFELATMRLSTARVCQVAPSEHRWAVKDQLTAQTQIVKDLAEGRRRERLCPRGLWLSKPVGYQLPEPSGYNLRMCLQGNYRLGERHQECPTESR